MEEGIWYTIKPGDTLSKIAERYKIDNWQLIYDHSKNSDFRINRPDPSLVFPGDLVWLPGVNGREAKGKSGVPTVFTLKPQVNYFTLELNDFFGNPHQCNTEIEVLYPDNSSKKVVTTGAKTKIEVKNDCQLNLYFRDGWIIKDDKPTFYMQTCSLSVKIDETVAVRVLILQPGDIILREGPGDDSVLIMKISGHPFSHAGIIVRDTSDSLVALDAYPGRGNRAIGTVSLKEFFDTSHANSGVIVRYYSGGKPAESKALQASKWALAQTKLPYEFDLMDEWSNNDHRLYCSEFVWRCYDHVKIELVNQPINFLSPKNKEKTINALIDYAYTTKEAPKYAPRHKVREQVLKIISSHSGEFVAPFQLAESTDTVTIAKVVTKEKESSQNEKIPSKT